mgnify:CR=1 FL=1
MSKKRIRDFIIKNLTTEIAGIKFNYLSLNISEPTLNSIASLKC